MDADLSSICKRVDAIRQTSESVTRDARHNSIRLARAGNYELIASDVFSESWPKPVIANFLNVAALDMAESLASLPGLSCASGSMVSETAKNKGAKRTKIGHYYWQHSNLKKFAVQGADWFFTYGFVPLIVEPDFKAGCPRIRFEDPFMSYPEIDRYGDVLTYTKVYRITAAKLAAMFPDQAPRLMVDCWGKQRGDQELEVVRYMDKHCTVMYANDSGKYNNREAIGLAVTENLLDRVPVAVAQRMSLDGQLRGQYDDAIWVQLARAKMASLSLEAGMKAVEAPIAVPDDLVEMPIGPDALWRTSQPEKIRRISMEMPQSAFAMDQRLNEEAMRSTRYPEARGGSIRASVITGKGVDALMGSYDLLIKTAQDQFGEGLREATSMAFELDEKAFGEMSKEIVGISAGAPYKEKYVPLKDIKGDYSCEVTYGLAAGLAPNNAVILMLQLLGAGLISKESVMKQLPFDVDPISMDQSITLERGRDAILQAMGGLASSIPAMAAQGMDPRQVVTQLSVFLDNVRGGKSIEEAASKAFVPPEPTPEELAAQEQQAAMEAQAAGMMGGGGGLVPEQEQALPDIQSMVSSFTSSRGGQLGVSSKRNQLL